ncbi:hypothetical protein EV426DRAFT_700965 [Tirmania nivea]|nr:hypothetical protein EV426DRAFT_700965 [Tirmania nivea]
MGPVSLSRRCSPTNTSPFCRPDVHLPVFLVESRTWEELDTPIWKKEEREEEEWDAVEAYFAYLYRPLPGL